MSTMPVLDNMHSAIPAELPSWPDLMSGLNRPSAVQLAKWLDISERTAYSYMRKKSAPRAVLLALFWLTPWGHRAVSEDLCRDRAVLHSERDNLLRRVGNLQARIAYLERAADFGTANAPVLDHGAGFNRRPLTDAEREAQAAPRRWVRPR